MGQQLADEYNIQFYQTSAKANIGVVESFEAIARDVKNRLVKDGGPATAPKRRLTAAQPKRGEGSDGASRGCCK